MNTWKLILRHHRANKVYKKLKSRKRLWKFQIRIKRSKSRRQKVFLKMNSSYQTWSRINHQRSQWLCFSCTVRVRGQQSRRSTQMLIFWKSPSYFHKTTANSANQGCKVWKTSRLKRLSSTRNSLNPTMKKVGIFSETARRVVTLCHQSISLGVILSNQRGP